VNGLCGRVMAVAEQTIQFTNIKTAPLIQVRHADLPVFFVNPIMASSGWYICVDKAAKLPVKKCESLLKGKVEYSA